ncbi:MAG TPA: Gfo/Idh/MocA family oxidoreductase [Bacteroidales bacterium]|jgi:predicted dehydrogenase|nr:Gfo/Idh/MocA family oxidoreductase [Bacteroidales bacterium]HPM19097.1 Gfo/Idh/MocA family oxidoreductase [Bacteroidales bacterium]HQG78545.1 Gfo/Idh/MocA family oxidoreductase [Bacteroidales bacterium]
MEQSKNNNSEKKKGLDRRGFISRSSLAAIGAIGTAGLLGSCSGKSRKPELKLPTLLNVAPDGKLLKAGLIGCGGRGTGAAINFLDAGPNLEITALGDVFRDKLDQCREQLKKERNVEIAEEKCFVGFDSFEKVIDSGVDIVLLCTPPHFRPAHVEAAVAAGKHIFMEKPCAVDPVGARRVMVAAKRAADKELSIVSGTIRRVQKDFMETQRRVASGQIGEIVSAHITRNGGSLWVIQRQKGWSDMEYMLRNWANFCWLSGDHIVEQFIHEIDVMNWYLGKNPVKAMAWGGRQRRVTGDQYDFFSVEYIYDNGMHTHCAARQITGCSNLTEQFIVGTEGFANARGMIYNLKGEEVWKYPYPEEGSTDETWKVKDPFVQEHINLVTAIRTGKPYNDAEAQVNSTLITIMGRMSAYTGKDVTWDEVLNSDLYLGPKTYEFGPVPGIPETPPVIGAEPKLG